MRRASRLCALLATLSVLSPAACSSSSTASSSSSNGAATSSTGKGSRSSSQTSTQSSTRTPSGSSSATSTQTASSGTDAGAPDASSSMTDAGNPCPMSGLYARLGGHAGIDTAMRNIVGQDLENGDIASYFFYQGEVCTTIEGGTSCINSNSNAVTAEKEGHPKELQIAACLTNLVGGYVGGPEKYSTADAAVTVDASDGPFTCRTMAEAHRGLMINEQTLRSFIMIAVNYLLGALKTSDPVCYIEDLNVVSVYLTSFTNDVVTVDGGGDLQPFPGSIDAALRLDGTY